MRFHNQETDIAFIKEMLMYAEQTQEILNKALRYGIDLSDEMVTDSLAMNIGQFGEQLSQNKLSEEVKERFEDILPWSRIRKFRNVLYHAYRNVNKRRILRIAQIDMPEYIDGLRYVLRVLEKELNKE